MGKQFNGAQRQSPIHQLIKEKIVDNLTRSERADCPHQAQ